MTTSYKRPQENDVVFNPFRRLPLRDKSYGALASLSSNSSDVGIEQYDASKVTDLSEHKQGESPDPRSPTGDVDFVTSPAGKNNIDCANDKQKVDPDPTQKEEQHDGSPVEHLQFQPTGPVKEKKKTKENKTKEKQKKEKKAKENKTKEKEVKKEKKVKKEKRPKKENKTSASHVRSTQRVGAPAEDSDVNDTSQQKPQPQRRRSQFSNSRKKASFPSLATSMSSLTTSLYSEGNVPGIESLGATTAAKSSTGNTAADQQRSKRLRMSSFSNSPYSSRKRASFPSLATSISSLTTSLQSGPGSAAQQQQKPPIIDLQDSGTIPMAFVGGSLSCIEEDIELAEDEFISPGSQHAKQISGTYSVSTKGVPSVVNALSAIKEENVESSDNDQSSSKVVDSPGGGAQETMANIFSNPERTQGILSRSPGGGEQEATQIEEEEATHIAETPIEETASRPVPPFPDTSTGSFASFVSFYDDVEEGGGTNWNEPTTALRDSYFDDSPFQTWNDKAVHITQPSTTPRDSYYDDSPFPDTLNTPPGLTSKPRTTRRQHPPPPPAPPLFPAKTTKAAMSSTTDEEVPSNYRTNNAVRPMGRPLTTTNNTRPQTKSMVGSSPPCNKRPPGTKPLPPAVSNSRPPSNSSSNRPPPVPPYGPMVGSYPNNNRPPSNNIRPQTSESLWWPIDRNRPPQRPSSCKPQSPGMVGSYPRNRPPQRPSSGNPQSAGMVGSYPSNRPPQRPSSGNPQSAGMVGSYPSNRPPPNVSPNYNNNNSRPPSSNSNNSRPPPHYNNRAFPVDSETVMAVAVSSSSSFIRPTNHGAWIYLSDDIEADDDDNDEEQDTFEDEIALYDSPSNGRDWLCPKHVLVPIACCLLAFLVINGIAFVILYFVVLDYDNSDGETTSGTTVAVAPPPPNSLPSTPPSNISPTASPSSPAPLSSPWPIWERADWQGSRNEQTLGFEVALSGNGKVLAVVGRVGDGFMTEVRMYSMNTNITKSEDYNNPWQPRGSAILSEETHENSFGAHVVLSETGDRVVIGAPLADEGRGAIYTYDFSQENGGEWRLVATLVGAETVVSSSRRGGSQLGYIFDLSDHGDILLTGEPLFFQKTGRVRLFRFGIHNANSGQWDELDLSLDRYDDFDVGDELGSSVSLSGSGTRLAIGSVGSDGTPTNGGKVTILDYNYDETTGSAVVESDRTLLGLLSAQHFGYKVTLSRDGTTIVASSRIGNVRVLQFDPDLNVWIDIMETADYDPHQFGVATTATNNGIVTAFTYLSCPEEEGVVVEECEESDKLGYVRILEFKNRRWTRLSHPDLVGLKVGRNHNRLAATTKTTTQEGNGSSFFIGVIAPPPIAVAMSKNGGILVAGIPGHTVNGMENAGLVRVFELLGGDSPS